MIDYGAESQAGPRPYNEDSQLIRDLSPFSERLGGLLMFMIVSDGMGGHQGGDVASRIAIETADARIDKLIEEAGRSVSTIDPEALLTEIAQNANEAVVAEARSRDISMGATYVAVFATADRAWVGHIGDSRAYLLRGGEVTQLTADHSQVGRMIADGVLTEEQAQHHPNRNVIERALGFGDGSGPELRVVDLGRNDVLLLCSDGLSTVLTAADLADIVSASGNLREAARNLVDEAIRLGSDDNTTVALWSPNRSPRTITDRRGGRSESARRRQRERRAQQRNARASRTSYYAAGVLGVALVGLVAIVLLSGGASSGGGRGAASGSRATTAPAGAFTPAPPPAQQSGGASSTQGEPVALRLTVKKRANVRVDPLTSSGEVTRTAAPMPMTITRKCKAGGFTWYYGTIDSTGQRGWVREDVVQDVKAS